MVDAKRNKESPTIIDEDIDQAKDSIDYSKQKVEKIEDDIIVQDDNKVQQQSKKKKNRMTRLLLLLNHHNNNKRNSINIL